MPVRGKISIYPVASNLLTSLSFCRIILQVIPSIVGPLQQLASKEFFQVMFFSIYIFFQQKVSSIESLSY